MAFFLKTLLRKSRLKKFSSHIGTGLLPLGNIRKALVIVDGTEPECLENAEKINSFFRKNNIDTSFIYIDLRKISKGTPVYVDGERVITRKDIGWTGMPNMKRKGQLFSGETDLLVNLRDSGDFTGDFISKVAKSAFKIGACDYPGNPFDLIIAGKALATDAADGAPAEEGTPADARTPERIDAICNFLKQII